MFPKESRARRQSVIELNRFILFENLTSAGIGDLDINCTFDGGDSGLVGRGVRPLCLAVFHANTHRKE